VRLVSVSLQYNPTVSASAGATMTLLVDRSAVAGIANSATTSLSESTQRWWLLALLAIGMIFCYAQRGTLSVAAPFMIQELGLSHTIMGLMLSAFS